MQRECSRKKQTIVSGLVEVIHQRTFLCLNVQESLRLDSAMVAQPARLVTTLGKDNSRTVTEVVQQDKKQNNCNLTLLHAATILSLGIVFCRGEGDCQ